MSNETATHYFHLIKIHGSACKFSAWFKGDPLGALGSLATLVDCERIDAKGRSYPCTSRQKDVLRIGPWTARQSGTF